MAQAEHVCNVICALITGAHRIPSIDAVAADTDFLAAIAESPPWPLWRLGGRSIHTECADQVTTALERQSLYTNRLAEVAAGNVSRGLHIAQIVPSLFDLASEVNKRVPPATHGVGRIA